MPKRVVDGEGVWRSDKLARVSPPRWRAEYANLLPLAFANGVFEVNPRRIWAMVYSYNRPDVLPDDVEVILNELERVKMLFRWTESGSGKTWGYWVGSDKPGRLPGKSRRGTNEIVGPEPPQDELRKFLDSDGIRADSIEQPNGTDLRPGLGLGFGFGLGSGSGSGVAPPDNGGAPSEAIACEESSARSGSKRKPQPSVEATRLAQFLRDEIVTHKPDARITKRQLHNWAVTADIMLSSDNRSKLRIAAVIRWAQCDRFWQANSLSMEKVREHFDTLELRARQKGALGYGKSLSDQAAESVAGAAKLIDAKAEELERAFGGDLRGGGKADA